MKRLLLAALVAAPVALAAQQPLPVEPPPIRGGLFATISPLAMASLRSKDLTGGETRSGSGFAAAVGYGLTTRLTILGDLTVTDLVLEPGSSYNLYHAEMFVRPSLKPIRVGRTEIVGFLDAGGGLVKISGLRPNIGFVEKHGFSGSFITFGLGTSVFVSHTFAVTATGHGSFGTFSDEKTGSVTAGNFSIGAGSLRAAFGVSWHPQRPR